MTSPWHPNVAFVFCRPQVWSPRCCWRTSGGGARGGEAWDPAYAMDEQWLLNPFGWLSILFFCFNTVYILTQYTQYIGDYHNPWILNDGWFSDASSRGLAMIRGYSRVIVSGDTVETFAPAEPWRSELNIFLERPWKGISNDTREHVNVRSSCFSFY
jgi:hypothetical protein